MKRNFLYLIISCFFIFLSVSAVAADETYTLDPHHTFVQWTVNHLGFSNQTGKWPATGTLILNQAHPQKSTLNVTINIADMITGNDELNNHLEAPIFFDAKKFPTATFVSKKIKVTSKNTATVEGVLTLHGVSKPVVLNVTLNKAGKNPITDKMSVGFSATTDINRSDFGVSGFIPAVSDQVKLNIEAEASIITRESQHAV